MKINYKEKYFILSGERIDFETFKEWYLSSFQPTLAKYYVKKDVYDWHSILNDVQHNGIIEIFESDKKIKK